MLTCLIREGSYGDVRFDGGLAVVLIIRFGGNALETNREFGFLIDDRANPAQRDALETIVTAGRAGSPRPGAVSPFGSMGSSLFP